MTTAEKAVLLQIVDSIHELHASLLALAAHSEAFAFRPDISPVDPQTAKTVAMREIQSDFDALRKQIEELA